MLAPPPLKKKQKTHRLKPLLLLKPQPTLLQLQTPLQPTLLPPLAKLPTLLPWLLLPTPQWPRLLTLLPLRLPNKPFQLAARPTERYDDLRVITERGRFGGPFFRA